MRSREGSSSSKEISILSTDNVSDKRALVVGERVVESFRCHRQTSQAMFLHKLVYLPSSPSLGSTKALGKTFASNSSATSNHIDFLRLINFAIYVHMLFVV